MMEILGASTSVADIWLGIASVDIDCGAGAESCSKGERLFAWYRRLLDIFGQFPCRFGIFGSVSASVSDIDAPGWSPGEYMPCGYLGSR